MSGLEGWLAGSVGNGISTEPDGLSLISQNSHYQREKLTAANLGQVPFTLTINK